MIFNALTIAVLTSFICLIASPSMGEQPQTGDDVKPEKKVFAHYMGCWPVGTGPLLHERTHLWKRFRHDVDPVRKYEAGGQIHSMPNAMYWGDHTRNFDLIDPNTQLTLEESADLEIRRAMRIGIDGFAIDAWAGDVNAKATFNALLKVAAEKDYPFEVTVCIDPMCGGDIVKTVKEVLEQHSDNPKLARRNGKPLIFGYQSWCMSLKHGWNELTQGAPEGSNYDQYVATRRTTPEGWAITGKVFEDAQEQIGQPIFFQYCLTYYFLNADRKALASQDSPLVGAAAAIAKHVDAVGGFSWLGKEQPQVAQAVQAAGAEWGMPIGMYQKENIPFEMYGPKGTDWISWAPGAIEDGSTLLQLVTWNDYGENTNIAPAYNTRYTLYDLTRYHIEWWKTGKEPTTDHDRMYLTYRKYPKGAKVFPFAQKFDRDMRLEVVTILTEPATVRLPGRDHEYEAPAGFHRAAFPLTPGPVIAEIVRNGSVSTHLESPEPITDRPFREDNGFTCFSTEDLRYWQEDFGSLTPPFWYSEYGDEDNDGLPNWFEMYWFGRWLDFSTATAADPAGDADGDGITNLEEYLDQTAPAPAPAH